MTRVVAAALLIAGLLPGAVFASDDQDPAWHKEATTLQYDRAGLEQRWRGRIQGFLDRGAGVLGVDDLERLAVALGVKLVELFRPVGRTE